ncbi:MAG: hypothetical protein K2P85_11035 [Flavobacteriaceae bacterium]|jgi:aspartate racemase|nr:hypothetical protein [Flavobacteriaceae bacterium]
MNKLGILGLGSKSTTYYIELLNLLYNNKYGGFNTCPFTMVNANFKDINPFLPNDFININRNILPYLRYINSLEISILLIPNITIHQAIDDLINAEKFNFKLIHPVDVLISHLKLNGIENVVILGTKYTMEGNYIQTKLCQNNIHVSKASDEVINEIEKIRIEIYNNNFEYKKKFLTEFVQSQPNLKVILACTELSVLANQNPLFIDMATLQIQKAIENL